jgi:hypothetical protein
VDSLISELSNKIATYVQTGGLSQNPDTNPAYAEIIMKSNVIKEIKRQYTVLQQDIANYITNNARYLDLSGTLEESGKLKQQLNHLEKINKKLDVDVETALARDELLRSKDTDRSSHMLFLLNRPVKKQMIPVLWIISIVFIGIALILVKQNMPTDILPVGLIQYIVDVVLGFTSQPIVLVSLLGAAIIVITFLSLKIARVI